VYNRIVRQGLARDHRRSVWGSMKGVMAVTACGGDAQEIMRASFETRSPVARRLDAAVARA
jgi:hypothetical protein